MIWPSPSISGAIVVAQSDARVVTHVFISNLSRQIMWYTFKVATLLLEVSYYYLNQLGLTTVRVIAWVI